MSQHEKKKEKKEEQEQKQKKQKTFSFPAQTKKNKKHPTNEPSDTQTVHYHTWPLHSFLFNIVKRSLGRQPLPPRGSFWDTEVNGQ